MRRAGWQLAQVAGWSNLRVALERASRGRRQHSVGLAGGRGLEAWIAQLRAELLSGSVDLGGYARFVIHDPKRRVIHAAPFRDRVLHHAIVAVAGPRFERAAINDSYACRPGKGVHAARARAQTFSRRWAHVLKLDVRCYFDSVSHDVLEAQLRRLFKDPELLALFGRILGGYHTTPCCGLPIGSLVSQYCANHYLSPLDRLVKERLRVRGYLRYMDDLLLWGDSAGQLEAWRERITGFLADELRLTLKPCREPSRCAAGVTALGARILPHALYPSRRSRRRLVARLEALEAAALVGRIGGLELQRRSDALLAAVAGMRCSTWRSRTLGCGSRPAEQWL